jgi:hypothetical protein
MRGTRTSGSEVRAGETDHRKRQHRAPVRPYSLAWLLANRRLTVRYERHADLLTAFLHLACALICARQAPTVVKPPLSPAGRVWCSRR